jgi:hypothetical protein
MYAARKEKFLVEATAFNTVSGESRDMSEHIQNINVKKDFVDASLPLVVVNIMTTQEYRDFMRDNDISLRLKVSKYSNVNEENEQDVESITIEDIVFDSIIKPYQKPFLSTSSKTEEDNEDINNQGDSVKVFPYQLVGIPESLVQKNKTVVNQIYSNAKIDEVLVNILSTVEKNKIFMDPSDNVDREENLIIPPMNIIPAIKYIQEVYGIYNSGISIFFDFDATYITKLFANSREYQNTLEVLSVSGNDNTTNISYISNMIDENNNVRLNLEVAPAFVSNQIINEDSVGQTTVFNSYDYNFNSVRRIHDENSNNGKTRYF